MSQPIDREGSFQALIAEYALYENEKTGSVQVGITADIHSACNQDGEEPFWEDWRGYELRADGFLNLIKKDGKPNATQVEALCRHAGWDGNITSIADGTWQPTPCRIDVKADTYEGETRYRVNWIAGHDEFPRGRGGNVDESKAKELQAKYGSSLRAIAGAAKANGSKPPAGKPAKPTPPPAPAVVTDDDVPF